MGHYDENIDLECIDLCNAINTLEGLTTIDSCCGHGDREFSVFFIADSLNALPTLLYHCDPCHVGFQWDCFVRTDCAMSPVTFKLRSRSVGDIAFQEANIIAEQILQFVGD